MDEPSGTPPDPGEDKAALTELVDATVQFTHQLMKKGVSQATLQVAVRCRPLNEFEKSRGYVSITRLVDDKVVIVLDPEHLKERESHLDILKRSREKQYVFDKALGESATNEMLYNVTVAPLVHGVLRGLNATVFAYGATGSGKTHTMVGDDQDPGLMVLSLRDIFEHISRDPDKQFIVECSYLEVYNELLYDLLEGGSVPLELREDPKQGAVVVGLKRIQVPSADHIFALLREGNRRRKTESTDANATSSRSHAVLEILCTRSDKNCYAKQVYQGKLALVDLAGAERAHETNNAGRQLRDGANINKSLLALANCINALGKRRKKEFVFVPFRNSKLTRLLKDGLCGNSRTIMVATVSSCNQQYHHTVNTLKYANRAKEIKTHVRRNQGTVDTHIKEYQKIIDGLQLEVKTLRKELTLARTGSITPEVLEGFSDEEGEKAPASIGSEIARLAKERERVSEALFRMDEEIVACTAEMQEWQSGLNLFRDKHLFVGLHKEVESSVHEMEHELEKQDTSTSGVNILRADESTSGPLEASGVHTGSSAIEAENKSPDGREALKDKGGGLDPSSSQKSNNLIENLEASWLGNNARPAERAESRTPESTAPSDLSKSYTDPLPISISNHIESSDETETRNNETGEKLKVIEKERLRLRDDLGAIDDALRALAIRIDREVRDVSTRRALHLEIELAYAHGLRQEATRAMEARNAVIDEQSEVIASLWRVLELAGIDRARALSIAKENGVLASNLSPTSSVNLSNPMVGSLPRRSQRSLGGTRASRRYNFWQERLKDLPLTRTPSLPELSSSGLGMDFSSSIGFHIDGQHASPVTGWTSSRSLDPTPLSHHSTPGRQLKPARSYVSQRRDASPVNELARARPHTGESRAPSLLSRKVINAHPSPYIGKNAPGIRGHHALVKPSVRSHAPMKARGNVSLANIQERHAGAESYRKKDEHASQVRADRQKAESSSL